MFKTMTSVLNSNKRSMPSDEKINKIPSYIFCRWLSGSPYAILAANQINMYDKIPMVNQFNMIKCSFGGKIKYIPYPKNISEKSLNVEVVVAKHFKISNEKAKEYVELIDKSELEEIINMY